MSRTMMSAPASASAIAWARPCPRAPPVMSATLPSSLPMSTPPVLGRPSFYVTRQELWCPRSRHEEVTSPVEASRLLDRGDDGLSEEHRPFRLLLARRRLERLSMPRDE